MISSPLHFVVLTGLVAVLACVTSHPLWATDRPPVPLDLQSLLESSSSSRNSDVLARARARAMAETGAGPAMGGPWWGSWGLPLAPSKRSSDMFNPLLAPPVPSKRNSELLNTLLGSQGLAALRTAGRR
ncbi:uncharacterized protein LOC143038906 [Oratosquilla oratoria]|uniref:uncharacterized protein LOC143038906 n=1 Tax=Oratosquilla oratoria TaxID=337810 RepID=UPI003F75BF04